MGLKSALTTDVMAFALRSPAFLSAATILVVAYLIRYFINRPPGLNLPVVDRKGLCYSSKELLEASRIVSAVKVTTSGGFNTNANLNQYPDAPYVLQTSPPLVILPSSTLDEVRNLPENQVSFMKDVRRMFAGEHTGVGETPPEVINAVKVDLTRHLASILDALQEEIRYSFDKEFGPCRDWTTIKLYGKLTRVVALLSGLVFVGRPLSRDDEWLDLIITYTASVIAARNAILKYPMYLRSFVAPFLKEIKRVKHHIIRGGELLHPILKAELAKKNNEKVQLDDSQDELGTFISWVLKHMGDKDQGNPLTLARNQMVCKCLLSCHHAHQLIRL
jgi:hypothetical protein